MDLFTLMMAYWMETVAIGFWNIAHMALLARWAALFLVPFFIVHFGGFMLGHFLFLSQMFGGGWKENIDNIDNIEEFLRSLPVHWTIWIGFGALFISHGLSFVFNALRPWWRGEISGDARQGKSVMMGTYGRVMVMHVTLLIGAALVAYFKTLTAAFVLLIALKIFVDVAAHIRKNFKPAAQPVLTTA